MIEKLNFCSQKMPKKYVDVPIYPHQIYEFVPIMTHTLGHLKNIQRWALSVGIQKRVLNELSNYNQAWNLTALVRYLTPLNGLYMSSLLTLRPQFVVRERPDSQD